LLSKAGEIIYDRLVKFLKLFFLNTDGNHQNTNSSFINLDRF